MWDANLDVAIADWYTSSVLDLTKVPGQAKGKNCQPTSGRIEVCNAAYGNNGWLGIAQIWVSGSHITQATAKQNDTYFSREPYNTNAWRQYVLCQEVGHTFGLDHIDEDYSTTYETCMDYNNSPDVSQHPYAHDYEQLETIYTHHLDGAATGGKPGGGKGGGKDRSDWGSVIERDSHGRPSLYRKDIGRNEKVFTFVIYADEAQAASVDKGKKDDGKRRR